MKFMVDDMSIETVEMPIVLGDDIKKLCYGRFVVKSAETCWAYGDVCFDEDCEDCNGTGEYERDVSVPWESIREIYTMLVNEHKNKEVLK